MVNNLLYSYGHKHFLVKLPNQHPLFHTINKKFNIKNKHFQSNNYYQNIKLENNTLDEYTNGITIEAAMKHPLYHHTIQNEPLRIGKHLADILYEI